MIKKNMNKIAKQYTDLVKILKARLNIKLYEYRLKRVYNTEQPVNNKLVNTEFILTYGDYRIILSKFLSKSMLKDIDNIVKITQSREFRDSAGTGTIIILTIIIICLLKFIKFLGGFDKDF